MITISKDDVVRGSDSSSFPYIHKVAPRAPCAAIAIKNITGEAEERIVSLLDGMNMNWRRNETYSSDVIKVLKELGYKAEKLSLGRIGKKKDKNSFSEVEFALRYPKGTYYVCTVTHAYVLHDQMVIDCVGKRNRRRIVTAYRIEKE